MNRLGKTGWVIPACLLFFFLVSVLLPLLSLLGGMTAEDFFRMLHSTQFGTAVQNSVATALAAALISTMLSMLAAWCIERTTVRWKTFWRTLFVLPMLLPSISHSFGIVVLLGANGLLTNLLGWEGSIYGFKGIVLGSVMYAFPVSFLMISNVLRYEDGTVYRMAEVLGIPPFRRFLDITFPYLRKTLISAFFAVFTMVITDYGVPLMIGGKELTLPVLMYQKAVAMLDYHTGSIIGVCLLVPAIIAFLADFLYAESGRRSFVPEPIIPEDGTTAKTLSFLFCVSLGSFILLPILCFGMITFETKYPVDTAFTLRHIEATLGRGADISWFYSVSYALLTAFAGTVLASLCAYLNARTSHPLSRGLHFASLLSMAIPGIVLGLSYVLFFHDMPFYGTIWIVTLVNTVHFFTSPYLMMYHAMGKLNPNLESVGQCLGVSRIRMVKDVILPGVRSTIGEMFLYFFVNSMMTISAVSFLAPPAPKPVSLMINQLEAQLLMESAAFVSLLILVTNLGVRTCFLSRQSRSDRSFSA